jgi:hypothetical protein
MKQKFFYGIRYYGGNRTCTYGTPNPVTGRYSIACGVSAFETAEERDAWLSREKLSAECGNGGGERVTATKRECRAVSLGCSVEDFERDIENQIKYGSDE